MLPEILIFICLIILAMSVVVYLRLLKSERELQSQEQEILKHAHNSANHILELARAEALKMLSAVKIDAVEDKKDLESSLEKISATELKDFKGVIKELAKDLQEETRGELTKFRQALELETVDSQKFVAQKIEAEYQAVLAAVEKYRQQKMAEVDQKTHDLIRKVLSGIAGKLISEERQTELIVQALEEAKKENVF